MWTQVFCGEICFHYEKCSRYFLPILSIAFGTYAMRSLKWPIQKQNLYGIWTSWKINLNIFATVLGCQTRLKLDYTQLCETLSTLGHQETVNFTFCPTNEISCWNNASISRMLQVVVYETKFGILKSFYFRFWWHNS